MSEFVIPNQIWDKDVECLDREELGKLQLSRLKDAIKRASNIGYYRSEFDKRGIRPDAIKSLADLKKLPFTTKQILRDYYPLGFFAVGKDELARIHASSGTTGKPTMVGYTRNDLKTWSELCARFLVAGGLTSQQVAQVAFGYGLFTGGFGLHYGIERGGACVVPASSGNTQRQLLLLKDLGVETLICTPSYALNLADALNESGTTIDLKYAHLGGEQWTEEMRERIENMLNIRAFNNYGLSEIIGPGVAGECACRCGMHIQEDHFIIECVDPETLEEVPDGEEGELVITALTKEACPIIRYRTRDLARVHSSQCSCGRTTRRMSRVKGRTDDMLIIRGVNVFPSQIEEALLRIAATAPHYQIELTRPHNLDEAVVKVEMRREDFSDKMDELQRLHSRIEREIAAITGIHFEIELVEPNSIERFVGKAKRVIDKRDLKIK